MRKLSDLQRDSFRPEVITKASVGADHDRGRLLHRRDGLAPAPYDVFLSIAYFSYRARGRAAINRYVQTSIRIIRNASGDARVPIHVIGGLASATTTNDV